MLLANGRSPSLLYCRIKKRRWFRTMFHLTKSIAVLKIACLELIGRG